MQRGAARSHGPASRPGRTRPIAADRTLGADEGRRLLAAVPALTPVQQQVAVGLVRLLASGAPVPLARARAALGLSPAAMEQGLRGLQTVETDDRGRVVSCLGLTLAPTAVRLEIDGRILHAWCAWDALALPELLGRPVRASAREPDTGRLTRVSVSPDGAVLADPPGTVLTFVPPNPGAPGGLLESFCRFVHFFGARAAAETWIARHDRGSVLPLPAAVRLARTVNRACFPLLLGAT